MFDEEAVANRWVLRSVKLAVAAVAILLAAWWLIQLRGSRGPTEKMPAQQVAAIRNRSEKTLTRRIAAEALKDADASIADELTAELSSGDAVGRELAAFALGRLDDESPGAVDRLIAALNDPEPAVRQQAATALGRLGARPEEVAAELVRSLHDAEPETRGAMFKALRRLGREGTRVLLGLLADSDADVRRRAVIELGRVGGGESEFLDALRGCLRDADARVRAETQAALWECSATHLDESIAALHDADPLVQSTACTLLGRMGGEAKPAIGELVKLMVPDGVCTWGAEQAIHDIDAECPERASALIELLDCGDGEAAGRAARLLGELRPASQIVKAKLLAHAYDPRDRVETWAYWALHGTGIEATLRPPELIEALEAAGDDVLSVIFYHGTSPASPSYGVTDQDLARLAGLCNLRLLDLRENPITDAGLEHVAAFGQLERLTLNKTKVTSAGLAHLAKLTKLRRLSLSECEIDDAGLAHLDRLTSLEFLDLGRTKVTDAGMQSLAGLARLKSVWLYGTQVTEVGLAHLSALAELEDIGYSQHFTLRSLAKLRGLVAVEPPPESVADEDLTLLAGMPKLRKLSLSRSGVTDAGLAHVGKLTQLELLGLDQTAITDAGLTHIAKLTQLQWLGLDQTQITDAGLAKLESLVNLKSLQVAKTRATDAGRKALERTLPNLEWPLVLDKGQPAGIKARYEVVGLKSEEEPDPAPSLP